MLYITDTHPIIWYLIGDSKLGASARVCFQQVDRQEASLIIPAVVLAEIFMVVEKSRVKLSATALKQNVRQWQSATNIQLTSLTPEIVITSSSLTAVPEIFDRLIVAEARLLSIPVITKDESITNSGLVQTIW